MYYSTCFAGNEVFQGCRLWLRRDLWSTEWIMFLTQLLYRNHSKLYYNDYYYHFSRYHNSFIYLKLIKYFKNQLACNYKYRHQYSHFWNYDYNNNRYTNKYCYSDFNDRMIRIVLD